MPSTMPRTLPGRLSEAIAALDDEQRSAVTAAGNLVITAGPGSGKTRTVVARAGFLLSTSVSPLRGLAAITYTNQAAAELRDGLLSLGVSFGRQVFSGTIHSFCLAHVLPYAPLVGVDFPPLDQLMSRTEIRALEQESADAAGVNVWAMREDFAGLRRRVAAGEDVSAEPSRYVRAVEHYEALCERRGVWDFEGIVLGSVRLLEDHPEVAEVLRARFPVVIVDEYQDLGAGLHRLVELLLESGVEVTAVGDVDQSIFGFSGGDPVYLDALSRRDDFSARQLITNYRCGSAVVAAAELTFDAARGYRADPRRQDPGVLEFQVVEGTITEQARQVVAVVQRFVNAGVPEHEIAVLLRNRKPLAKPIEAGLRSRGVPVQHGGLVTGPATELGRWLEAAALYSARISTSVDSTEPPEVGMGQLLDRLDALRRLAGFPRPRTPHLARLTELHTVLCAAASGRSPTALAWLRQVVDELQLTELAECVGDPRTSDELDDLLRTPDDVVLDVLATDSSGSGRVVISTFHGAKGRTFSAVVVPGLTEGVIPPWTGPVSTRRPKTGEALEEERRGFYVALTRSRGSVVLQVTSTGIDHQGYETRRGYSSFARDLAARLGVDL